MPDGFGRFLMRLKARRSSNGLARQPWTRGRVPLALTFVLLLAAAALTSLPLLLRTRASSDVRWTSSWRGGTNSSAVASLRQRLRQQMLAAAAMAGGDSNSAAAVGEHATPPPAVDWDSQLPPAAAVRFGWPRWRWRWVVAEGGEGVHVHGGGVAAIDAAAGADGQQEEDSDAGNAPSELVVRLQSLKHAPAPPTQAELEALRGEANDLRPLLPDAAPAGAMNSSSHQQTNQADGAATPRQQQQQQQQNTWPPVVDAADTTSAYIQARGVQPAVLKYPLWWHGPMWAGSGYGSGAQVAAACAHRSWRAPHAARGLVTHAPLVPTHTHTRTHTPQRPSTTC
jgi:hypothetical protein